MKGKGDEIKKRREGEERARVREGKKREGERGKGGMGRECVCEGR